MAWRRPGRSSPPGYIFTKWQTRALLPTRRLEALAGSSAVTRNLTIWGEVSRVPARSVRDHSEDGRLPTFVIARSASKDAIFTLRCLTSLGRGGRSQHKRADIAKLPGVLTSACDRMRETVAALRHATGDREELPHLIVEDGQIHEEICRYVGANDRPLNAIDGVHLRHHVLAEREAVSDGMER